MSSREIIIAANWKMYKTIEEAESFIDQLSPAIKNSLCKVYIAPPYTAIKPLVKKCEKLPIIIGAQNMHDADDGAFTGEIAGRMLKDAGAKFVILGHSERRQIFCESNAYINKKVLKAFKTKIRPIVCVGETLEQREKGETHHVLETQLKESLAGLTPEQLSTLIIAYEPVWAIGTGITATPAQAEEAQAFCRTILEQISNLETAKMIPILYGGSVKPDNIKALMEQPNIDGALVGGASLKPESFSQIINFQTENHQPSTTNY